MNDDGVQNPNQPRTWLEKISHALLGEPKDREQLISLLRDAQKREVLDPDALRMIEGVLQVSDMRVSEIMIPKSEMVVIDKELSLEEILPIVISSAHSRFPVIGDSKDEVIGILLAKDLLIFQDTNSRDKFNIREVVRPTVFIPESKRLDNLLNEFRQNRNHLAIVVDEYGGVSGLVTIEDVLEQIVGDIEDEHDISDDLYIRKHKLNTYSLKATTPISEFNEFFNTNLSDQEFDTIGGLVMNGFGYLPKRGEEIYIEEIPFKILKATTRRIQLLQTTFKPLAK